MKSCQTKKTIKCYWCREKVLTAKCHADHITPLSKGGPHSVENLCVSCPKCNHAKSAKLLEKWNSQLIQPILL